MATRLVDDATAEAYAAAIGTQLNPDYEGPIDRALSSAGFDLRSTTVRQPMLAHESTSQAFVLASAG